MQGRIIPADIARAKQLHSKLDVGIAASAVVFFVLVAWIIADSVQAGDPEIHDFGWLLARIALAVVALAILATKRPWAPREVPEQELQRTIDRDGIEIVVARGRVRFNWEDVIRSKRSDEMVILYVRTNPPEYIFPRRLFSSDGDWEKFRSWVEARTL